MIATTLCAIVSLLPQVQDPEPGVSLELAQARARLIGEVSYQLSFVIDAGAKEVTGHAWVIFKLGEDAEPTAPVVLDFAGTELSEIRVNDLDPEGAVRLVNGHVVVPPSMLHAGLNGVTARFRSPVAATGTPLSVYRDSSDGREYWYTLVVPADAHRLYPCFDQPDLKARYVVQLDIPMGWVAVANGKELEDESANVDGRRRVVFARTAPLSTYLMAFAAGPFAVVDGPRLQVPGVDANEPLRIYLRPSQQSLLDRAAVVRLHQDGLRWLCAAFGMDYPFEKLDVVLIPGFPYGGMEHAGAIFYREQAVVFDHPPTDSELVRRSSLVYHELSHQWFGNLVTMRWFDDLWLKEGFATFLGYRCLEALEPEKQAWLRFLQRVKPRAYEVDATAGTTPVYQALGNLADAKSAYGAIVYNKAPAVLRELFERIGADAFRAGLQRYLRSHAFGNADWRDLAGALEAASRTDLESWSQRWLLSPSMPQVRVEWQVDANGLVRECHLRQRSLGAPGLWPLRLKLAVFDAIGSMSVVEVETAAASCDVPELVGRAAPACVLCNPDDVAYGQFLIDATSRAWLLEHVTGLRPPLLRAVATAALFESVREADLDPAKFWACALDLLAHEQDPETHAWILDMVRTCLNHYLAEERRQPLEQRAVAMLLAQLQSGAAGRELQIFRFLAHCSRDAKVMELCHRVAGFGELPAGLRPGKQDRFLAVAALLAAGADRERLVELVRHYVDADVGKEAYLAEAAIPTEANKQHYWEQYCNLESPPEQWTQDSLPFFHWHGQEALTLPYLKPALEKVEWVKQHRKIFFMPAWLDGFINGHDSAAALTIVEEFLRNHPQLAPDIRAKILQSLDALSRSTRIHQAWD